MGPKQCAQFSLTCCPHLTDSCTVIHIYNLKGFKLHNEPLAVPDTPETAESSSTGLLACVHRLSTPSPVASIYPSHGPSLAHIWQNLTEGQGENSL